MKKFILLCLSLVMGLCAFAQQVAVKSQPAPVKVTLERKSLGAEVFKGTANFETRASSKPVVVNEGVDYMDAETIYTTYDLQSNGSVSNRMYQLEDGSVAVVATMSRLEYDNAFMDRGTGYNFAKGGKIYKFGGVSAIREEAKTASGADADMRTGWPTIAPYGAEGEILVNHADGLNYWIREKAGEGEWDGPHAIPNPEDIDEVVKGKDNVLAMPRIVTTGENNEVLHVFATASGDSNVANYYLRTSNLEDWTIKYSPLEMDDLHINVYSADDAAVSANGDNIAVVYCAGFSAHVMLYESNDGGETWSSRMVWESPIHGLDWATDENSLFSRLYGPTQASVAIGKDGVTHVALGVGLYDRKTLGASYSLYYGMLSNGVAYWNDTTRWNGVLSPIRSSQDDSLKHALRLWWPTPENPESVTLDPTNFCAWMPPHKENGFDEFDYRKQYTGSDAGTAGDYLTLFGLTAYPSIAVDPAGNLAVAYSAPDLNRAMWKNTYYMRSIFVNYKPADSANWSQMTVYGKSFYEDFVHSGDEATFISAVSTPVNENEFWFSCLSDDTPGFHTGYVTSQTNITTSVVNVFKFDPTGELNDYDEGLGEPSLNSVFVFASVNSENTGTVTGSGVYNYGEEVTLSATPNEGYRFLNWTENGEVVSTNAQYSFTAYQERILIANFVDVNEPEEPEEPGDEPEEPGDEPEEPGDDQVIYYNVEAVANPEEGGTITGAGVYEENENVTLTATANECYRFVNWTEYGDVVSTNVKYSFKITEDRDLVANFELMTYDVAITVNPENAGTVTGAGTYLGNQEVTLTATPISGYRFVNWLEDGVVLSTNTEYTFAVTKDRNVIANFVAIGSNLLTVFINPKEAGEVEGAGAYTENATVTLKAIPESSYKFLNWTENDVIVSTEKEYTFVLTSDRNLVANFVAIKYEVTAIVDPEEAGEVEGAGIYQKNTRVTLVAKANKGYKFVSWTEDDEVVSEDEEYSFVIKRDVDLVANFVSTEGIEELTSSFRIYPNPANDKLYIETEVEIEEVVVYDIYGRQQSTDNGQQPSCIDVSGLNSGVYFVKVVTDNGEVVKCFVKK